MAKNLHWKCQCRCFSRSSLGSLLLLSYINVLSGDLSSKTKLFADDICLFKVVHEINALADELNSDLKSVSNWAFQWKMSFSPDPSKQIHEANRSKLRKVLQPPLIFSNANVSQFKSQKHLGIKLDSKLTSEELYKTVLKKTRKTIGLKSL